MASHVVEKPREQGTLSIAPFFNWLWRPAVFLRLGMLLLAALYIRTLAFDFVYDDVFVVLSASDWRLIPSLFTQALFGGSVYYRPLTGLVELLIKMVFGGSPAWFHLAALGTHLAVFYLAYVLGRFVLRNERTALLAALLYALHPSKVESVAWIGSGLCDGMAAIFFFGVLICYFRWRETNSRGWFAGSVALFVAALLTKETMVVLPVLVALHYGLTLPPRQAEGELAGDPARLGPWFRPWVRLLAPYGVVLAGYMVVRHLVIVPTPASSYYIHPTLDFSNLWSAPLAFWWYVRHLVWPTGLAVIYNSQVVSSPSLRLFVLPALGLGVVLAAAFWLWWRHRSVAGTLLIAWFVLTLAPVVVLSTMVLQHDRYLHLPSYPFCVLVAVLLLGTGGEGEAKRRAAYLRAGVGVILIALWSVSVWHEMGFWDHEELLWTRAVSVAPARINSRVLLAQLEDGQGKVSRRCAS